MPPAKSQWHVLVTSSEPFVVATFHYEGAQTSLSALVRRVNPTQGSSGSTISCYELGCASDPLFDRVVFDAGPMLMRMLSLQTQPSPMPIHSDTTLTYHRTRNQLFISQPPLFRPIANPCSRTRLVVFFASANHVPLAALHLSNASASHSHIHN
jgi:hypothetical protein